TNVSASKGEEGMRSRTLAGLAAFTFAVLLSSGAHALTCTQSQEDAILAALPPCGEAGSCASTGDVSKATGMGALVCQNCLNQMVSEGSVATCTLPGPPIVLDGGWCRL